MKQPRTFYLARFPSRGPKAYRNQSYWDGDEEHRARAFIRHVWRKYKIRGRVIETIEVKRKKK